MKKYELLIFDLDGTLVDTSEGILKSHKFTNLQMGRREPADEELVGIIGAPLLDTYMNRFGYNEEEAKRAIKIYRERYGKYGILEVCPYNAMYETLEELKRQGYKLAVATLKAESFAQDILNNLNIAKFFDVIHGVDNKDSLTKCDLIKLCIGESNCNPNHCVLIGDSMYDACGAEQAGIEFIAVTYGFGVFTEKEAYRCINTPKEIFSML